MKNGDDTSDTREEEGLLHHRGRFANAFEWERERTLADFVGAEREAETFAALRTPTPSLSTLVKRFMEKHFTAEQLLMDQLKARWPEVVGAQYAAMLRPLNVVDHCLAIEASNATVSYAYCNPSMQRIFLSKLKSLGFGDITMIRVVLPGRR